MPPDRSLDEARAIGSVNTVTPPAAAGQGTDWSGFRQSVRDVLPDVRFGRVVKLRAGGAARQPRMRCSIWACASSSSWTRFTSVPARSRIDWPPCVPDACRNATWGRRCRAPRDSSTPRQPGARASGSSASSLASARGPLGRRGRLFPLETELLHAARQLGCRTPDGAGMAVSQAAEAFRLFTGLQADAARMRSVFQSFDASLSPGGIVERPSRNPGLDLTGCGDQLPGSRRADRGAVDPAAVRVEPGRDGGRVWRSVDVFPRPGVRRPARRFGTRAIYSPPRWPGRSRRSCTPPPRALRFWAAPALGLAEAPCFPANSNVVAKWFPRSERGRAIVYTAADTSA